MRKTLEVSLFFGVLLFAYQIAYHSGERGFFAFDQSIVFDGSYRVLIGQIPYRDFVIPFGPVTFWIQSAIFKLIGVSYASYIFGAAVVNLTVAGVSFYLLRLLFPKNKLVAYSGSLLTAVWFYPPLGTPWPDQTAFAFALAALTSTITAYINPRVAAKRTAPFHYAAGIFAAVAFFSKQNAGAFILPVLAVTLLVANIKEGNFASKAFIKDLILLLLGWITGIVVFALWLILESDTTLFLKHFIEIPLSEVSRSRLPGHPGEWLVAIFLGTRRITILSFSLIFPLIGINSLLRERNTIRNKNIAANPRLLAAVSVITLFLYQNVYLITSNNQVESTIPFIGLIAAIGFGLLKPDFDLKHFHQFSTAQRKTALLHAAVFVAMIGLFAYGIKVSLSRQVHDIFKASTFPHHMATGKLSALKWGEPTRIHVLIHAEDVDQLVEFLDQQDVNFLIFPDFTILYGILEAPSPQPLLWFHKGLTYPREYDPSIDAWIVSELQENQVQLIVLEAESWFSTDERLADFPQLKSYIDEHFSYEKQIGNFRIYVYSGD